MYPKPRLNDPEKPLVSVLIFNYNYGRYLRQCIDSVIDQTYDNIEINFSDNASTDESWKIAQEYASKYPGFMNITCNRKNFGVYANFLNCMANTRGKYFIELGSDDALTPEFVERCVIELERYHTAAFAMTNRTIIDENGNLIEDPPFYNQSCLIPGEEQAAVYMMAAVNPTVSQVMYRTAFWRGISTDRILASRWYAQRIHDFALVCEFDMLYLKDSLVYHRLHKANDSFSAAGNLMEILGPYVMQHQFADTAAHRDNMQKTVDRLPASLTKLSNLCLRYCTRGILDNKEKDAIRYFYLSIAIDPDIRTNPDFILLKNYWDATENERGKIVNELKAKNNFVTRAVSYDPPPGSIPLYESVEQIRMVV